jgi:hypothetical protein
MQNEQVQPMRNEPMNAPIMEATQWVQINIQHQISIEYVVHMETTIFSNIHHVTPHGRCKFYSNLLSPY